MKIALINATGTTELHLLDEFVARGHHVAYLTKLDLPHSFLEKHPPHTLRNLEHHRVGLDDPRQLVTAFHHCRVAVVCRSDLPITLTDLQRANLVFACNAARVPDLVEFDFHHPHPLKSNGKYLHGPRPAHVDLPLVLTA